MIWIVSWYLIYVACTWNFDHQNQRVVILLFCEIPKQISQILPNCCTTLKNYPGNDTKCDPLLISSSTRKVLVNQFQYSICFLNSWVPIHYLGLGSFSTTWSFPYWVCSQMRPSSIPILISFVFALIATTLFFPIREKVIGPPELLLMAHPLIIMCFTFHMPAAVS